jgi:uncharacterized protein
MKRYIEWIIRYRLVVVGLGLVVTLALGVQVKDLRVTFDPNTNLPPDHPYVTATREIEDVFGLRNVVLIGIRPKVGDLFQPVVLEKVERITKALLEIPGVIESSVLSLAAPRVKNIAGTAEGMDVRPLMEKVPRTREAIEALRRAVRQNPVYVNTIASADERTAVVLAEFHEDAAGYRGIIDKVDAIVDRERDASVDITIGGRAAFLSWIETYSHRIAFLFPLAVLVTGLIHYEAFRTVQGLVLPLVTALLAVVWAVGVMGLSGVPMDPFNVTTPILILTAAAGHAVQILKRYYEEYHRLRASGLEPGEANRRAVCESMTRIGPVMLAAGFAAALGFFSLTVFDIRSIRTFGIFTGLGVLSALIVEMSFTPALRSMLRPPGDRETDRERERTIWDRITMAIAEATLTSSRARIYAGFVLVLAASALGISRVTADSSLKGYFFPSHPTSRDDDALNRALGGTNTLYVLVDGRENDAVKAPRLLQAMESVQRFLEQEPLVGKTLSLADFVKRMHRAMNGDEPAYDRVPDSRNLIAQYLLLYSMSGDADDFSAYVDDDYRRAVVRVFLKSDSDVVLQRLVAKLTPVLHAQFGDAADVRLGGSITESAALNEIMIHGKMLNIIQLSGVIFVVAAFVFRSLVAGVLVLVPLGFAVAVNFGLMGLAGIPVNAATATISATVVGIGADYAIYLLYRIREEIHREGDVATAFRTALTTAGKATLFVASAIAGGYGVLFFSWGFYVHIWIGALISVAMLVSAFSVLILVTSLVLSLRPKFIFADPSLERPRGLLFSELEWRF